MILLPREPDHPPLKYLVCQHRFDFSPQIKRELLELESLAVPKSLDGKGALLQKLQRKIDEKLKILLFQNNMNKPGGEKVREGFQKFQTEILQVDPIYGMHRDR